MPHFCTEKPVQVPSNSAAVSVQQSVALPESCAEDSPYPYPPIENRPVDTHSTSQVQMMLRVCLTLQGAVRCLCPVAHAQQHAQPSCTFTRQSVFQVGDGVFILPEPVIDVTFWQDASLSDKDPGTEELQQH